MKNKRFVLVISVVLILSMFLTACAGLAETDITESEVIQSTNELQEEEIQSTEELQDFEFPDFDPVWGTMAFPGEYNSKVDVRVDYAYSDRYFDFDSSLYNPSLATMSLCLELSAWASYETDVWEEKSRNARKLLDEIGFVDFAQNEFWNDKPSTESIGVVAAHKKLEDCTLIALPVRGGKYYNEWGSNVAVGMEGAHTGFTEGRDNVVEFLEKYIIDCNITGRVKIWLVGYSRGGAVANLVAGYLNENELPNGATLAFEDLYCYAFEPPQGTLVDEVGDDANHANIHNIVNSNDLVTMVAPVDWDFARYNTTSRLLPTITTAEFDSALATMLEEYEEILAGVEITDPEAAVYNVSEYAKKLQIEVNPLSFLASGDPFIEVQVLDDTRQTMNEVLTRFITSFVGSINGRETYNASLEADLVHLLDLLMGYDSGLDMNEVMDAVMETMTANDYENLKYVLTPVIQLNTTPMEERVDQVVVRLKEVLPQPEGFSDLYGTADTLIQALAKMLVNHPDELLDILLAFTNSKVMQAHYEEITLAWVRAGDPHYTDTPYTMEVPEALRVVRINCPVDVEVYDSKGDQIASMIDGVSSTSNSVVGCAINEEDEIILHLPADEEYDILVSATDDGEVNITLSEYNVVHSRVTRVQNYPDIPVEQGDMLTMAAPSLTEEEFFDQEQQGSTVEYCLLGNDGEEIVCQREAKGNDINFFNVDITKNNAYGVVTGGGQYLDGSFALVKAQPVAGSTFMGWYENGVLVSEETEYRFAAEKDVSLVAYFSEVDTYEVYFRTSGLGTVSNVDQAYSAGSKVQLLAEAAEGYTFDHWETTSGSIENPADAQTIFVVAESDATVTAVFKGENIQESQPDLPEEEKTNDPAEDPAAGCGTEGHYANDGKDHAKQNCGHYVCAGGEHQLMTCDHYACIEGDHEAAVCGTSGHYVCDAGKHTAAICGITDHYSCGGSHEAAACGTVGHLACDEDDHSAAGCGNASHHACDTADHSAAGCGKHFVCDGESHAAADCKTAGHYVCDGYDHTTLHVCSHPACAAGEHVAGSCGVARHYICDGEAHDPVSCFVEITLDNPTAEVLKQTLEQGYMTVNVSNAAVSVDAMAIASGQTVNIISGTLTINGATTHSGALNINSGAALSNGGTITGDGTLTNSGTFSNANENFNPSTINFVNLGSYEDNVTRTSWYILAADGSGVVQQWDTLENVLGYYNEGVWTSGYTYTLYGEQTAAVDLAYMDSVTGVTFDLNGRTLYVGMGFMLQSSTSLTIKNGTVESAHSRLISVSDSSLVLDQVNVSTLSEGNGAYAIQFFGTNTITVQNSSKVSSGGYAMLCDTYAGGTRITINGSTVTGGTAGIYLGASKENTAAYSGMIFSVDGETMTYEELIAQDETGGMVGGIKVEVNLY